jgi:site-specific recombinase XerD
LPLKDGLQAFVAVYMPARNYAGRTREEYASDLDDLITFLDSRQLTSWLVVGLRDLQAYMAELDRRGLGPSSRNRRTYAINTFFTFLTQSGYLRENPALQLIPPTILRKERRFLREEEYQAPLAQVLSIRDRAILELFLQTGLRLSELAHLTTNDIRGICSGTGIRTPIF